MILFGALVIAMALSVGVYHYFGADTGYYFALLVALPLVLGISGVCYLLYAALIRKQRSSRQ